MTGLLLLLVVSGCAAQEAPERWPESGCTSSLSERRWPRRASWQVEVDGVSLAVSALEPRSPCHPAVVLTPGGLQPGLSLLGSVLAEQLASEGIGVYTWDPPGRGESAGEEDANGTRGQDALAGVLRWVASQDGVDPGAVVLYTRSLGAALGAGALARHPDLSLAAWIDYEGPGWLEDDQLFAAASSQSQLAALASASADPESWWLERSPAHWVSDTRVPYRRLQGLPDHALGPRVAHAQAMLSGGTDPWLNGIPAPTEPSEDWVRENVVEGGLSYDGAAATVLVRDALPW